MANASISDVYPLHQDIIYDLGWNLLMACITLTGTIIELLNRLKYLN